jgi:hypothetical protein
LPSSVSWMANVVNEAPSALGSYGYTYGVLGGSCTATTSQHTCQVAFRDLAEVLLYYINMNHIA